MSDSIKIKSSNGFDIIISIEDYETINRWRWRVGKNGYAVRNSTSKQISMHHQIFGHKSGYEIDHINRNKLDNRRENLRFVTRSLNNLNRPIDPRNISGCNGVTITKKGLYRARLSQKELGFYQNIDDAIKARKNAEQNLFENQVTSQHQ